MKNEKRKTRTRSLLKAIRRRITRRFYGHRFNFNPKYFYPRHLARSVAKHNMAKAGAQHINSIFSYYWRDYVRVR